jgi:hypothetical protein
MTETECLLRGTDWIFICSSINISRCLRNAGKAKSNTENVRDLNLTEVKITIFEVSKLPSQQQHDLQYRLTQQNADSAD